MQSAHYGSPKICIDGRPSGCDPPLPRDPLFPQWPGVRGGTSRSEHGAIDRHLRGHLLGAEVSGRLSAGLEEIPLLEDPRDGGDAGHLPPPALSREGGLVGGLARAPRAADWRRPGGTQPLRLQSSYSTLFQRVCITPSARPRVRTNSQGPAAPSAPGGENCCTGLFLFHSGILPPAIQSPTSHSIARARCCGTPVLNIDIGKSYPGSTDRKRPRTGEITGSLAVPASGFHDPLIRRRQGGLPGLESQSGPSW